MVASIPPNSLHDDNDLARRVRIYFATQSRPALRAVQVQAQNGVITLRGQVHSFYEKQLSLHIAARVAGVRRLEDELIVQA
jgi:osmotically-inducible protein OsmY